jgi:hypothetical protein
MQNHTPHFSSVHCMARCTNLVVALLSSLKLVSKVESLLAGMYNYFAHNFKRRLEFCKLAKNLESMGTSF